MGTFVGFLAVLIAVLLVLAFAIALISRTWVVRTEEVQLRGIDVTRARDVVAMYVESVHDTRFGFPTGIFRIDADRSGAERLVAREINFDGSMGFRIARYGFMIPAALMAAGAEVGAFAAIMAFMVGAMFAAIFIMPIVAVSIVEVVLRFLMRSEVTADLARIPGDVEACSVRFTLRGLSAFGVRKQLLSGLARPVLPTAYGGSPIENAPEPWTDDRLNVVYASGAGIAVLAATLIVALTPSLHGGGGSGGYAAYGSTSDTAEDYDSSSYDDGSSSSDTSTTDDSYDNSSEEGEEEPSTALSTGLSAHTADGGAFTIHPPAGWVRDRRNENRGTYYESSWHERGNPDATFLVDYTPGFSGTPRRGAQGVRKLFRNVSDYVELDFSPTDVGDFSAWRWEFESRGLHKLDTFLVECGTGFAALGAAPSDSWVDYVDLFEAAIQTLSPTCDGSGGDDSSVAADTAEPTPSESSEPTETYDGSDSADASAGSDDTVGSDSTAASSGGGSGTGTSEAAITVLRRHFALLSDGNYDAAFALMSPAYRAKSARWPAARAAEAPRVNLIDAGPARVEGADAWVHVRFLGRNGAGGDRKCRRFTGTAHLLHVGGAWRYDPVGNHYEVQVMHSWNGNCP